MINNEINATLADKISHIMRWDNSNSKVELEKFLSDFHITRAVVCTGELDVQYIYQGNVILNAVEPSEAK